MKNGDSRRPYSSVNQEGLSIVHTGGHLCHEKSLGVTQRCPLLKSEHGRRTPSQSSAPELCMINHRITKYELSTNDTMTSHGGVN